MQCNCCGYVYYLKICRTKTHTSHINRTASHMVSLTFCQWQVRDLDWLMIKRCFWSDYIGDRYRYENGWSKIKHKTSMQHNPSYLNIVIIHINVVTPVVYVWDIQLTTMVILSTKSSKWYSFTSGNLCKLNPVCDPCLTINHWYGVSAFIANRYK